MNNIRFYMQRVDAIGNDLEPPIDLEKEFEGLEYYKSSGIDSIGESAVYEETYADSDKIRVYVPENPINKPTKVELTFIFVGEKRREIRSRFDEYIRRGYHRYWDTARHKEFIFYIKERIDTGEEKWFGSNPYIEVTYKLNNINGKTTNKQTNK